MSEFSLIEWTDATWNPLLGCSKCSAGCQFCYAIRTAWRLQHNPDPTIAAAYAGLVEQRADGSLNWTGKINLLPDRLRQPLHWKKPRKIFVNSQSDLFHENVPSDFINQVFAVMALCPQHTFQVLTKRADRMRDELQRLAKSVDPLQDAARELGYTFKFEHEGRTLGLLPWPIPNIMLGVSVEDQRAADERVPALIDTPAAARFLSCEPLLGPLELAKYFWHGVHAGERKHRTTPSPIDWVIVGGESGAGARPMHPDWPRYIRNQCEASGVHFFFKQWGMWIPAEWKLPRVSFETDENYRRVSLEQAATHAINILGGKCMKLEHAPFSADRSEQAPKSWAGVRLVGKKAAGRLLDGIEHNAFPPPRRR